MRKIKEKLTQQLKNLDRNFKKNARNCENDMRYFQTV